MGFKRFVVRVEGVEHDVDVESVDDDSFEVRVDGAVHRVTKAPDRAWRVASGEGPAHHTVHLGPGGRARPAVVRGVTAEVEIQTAQQAALDSALAAGGGGSEGGASVTSPMPGRVVRVLVEMGAEVERDQPIIIVEAMKMENEVRAPSSGVISGISASAGETVEAGQLLVELTLHPDSTRA